MMEAWISFGGLMFLKSTAVLGLVFTAGLVLRRASASAQHYLWTLAYVALLTLPVGAYLSSQSSSWRIPVPVLQPSAAPTFEGAPAPSPVGNAPTVSRNPRPTSRSFALPSLPLLAWIFGSVVFIARLGAGIVASRRATRDARSVDDEAWLDLLGDAQARMGVLNDVNLRTTSASPLPMTVGVWHPTILLPHAASDYSLARRWAVLLHELAHIRRRDCLTQLVCQIACAVFWWHPLAWIGARHMRALSERASNDLVLEAGAKPSEYAHDLLDMARGLNLRGVAAPISSVTMAHRSRLEDRLLAILDPEMARRAVTSRTMFPAAVFGLGIFASFALAIPTVAVSVLPPQEEARERPATVDDDDDDREELTDAQRRARLALAEALDDPDASVREHALGALVRVGDERTVPYLIEALASGDANARADAAWGLGKMRHQDATVDLIDALSDESDNVREQSAWSLGMIRSERAVEALGIAVMNDTSSNVREQASIPVANIETMSSLIVSSSTQRRFHSTLFAAFAAGALFLAAIGVYALLSFLVTERTGELGVRLALGAPRARVVMLVLRHGVALTVAGLTIGGVVALALARTLESFLFQVRSSDPATFAAIAVLLLVVAGAASFVPAYRASRVDPLRSIRYE